MDEGILKRRARARLRRLAKAADRARNHAETAKARADEQRRCWEDWSEGRVRMGLRHLDIEAEQQRRRLALDAAEGAEYMAETDAEEAWIALVRGTETWKRWKADGFPVDEKGRAASVRAAQASAALLLAEAGGTAHWQNFANG